MISKMTCLMKFRSMNKSKKIHIQFQPDLVEDLKLSDFEAALKLAQIDYSIKIGDDNGKYINYDFVTDNPASAWEIVKREFNKDQRLVNSSIVCCEGSRSWDNYLLLSHFDKSQNLDEI